MNSASRYRGFLLGSLVGDALGLPANGRPHHIVRMYFKGIKGYTDEYYTTASPTGLRAGQTSIDPRPILKSLPENPSLAIDLWIHNFFQLSETWQKTLTKLSHELLEKPTLEQTLLGKLFDEKAKQKILDGLDLFPTDLVSHFDGAMTEPDAIQFALSMLLRSHDDFETTVLSTINMGGLSRLTGAIAGGMMGLLHGEKSIPESLILGLERSEEILSALNS
jgi:hypothetical protein